MHFNAATVTSYKNCPAIAKPSAQHLCSMQIHPLAFDCFDDILNDQMALIRVSASNQTSQQEQLLSTAPKCWR
jgi:hypothetical protein